MEGPVYPPHLEARGIACEIPGPDERRRIDDLPTFRIVLTKPRRHREMRRPLHDVIAKPAHRMWSPQHPTDVERGHELGHRAKPGANFVVTYGVERIARDITAQIADAQSRSGASTHHEFVPDAPLARDVTEIRDEANVLLIGSRRLA